MAGNQPESSVCCTAIENAPDLHEGYGPAVVRSYRRDDGTVWVDNDEGGGSRVNFCPFCGYEASEKIAGPC